MKLGGGYVKLGQELPLEAGERESKLDFLEHCGVDEAEGAAVAPLVIGANRLSRRTRMHRYLVIVFLAEGKVSLPFLRRRMSRSVLMDEVSASRVGEAQGYSCL